MSQIEHIARAIDPVAWSGLVLDLDGQDVTTEHRKQARQAARRVLGVLGPQSRPESKA
jgi:hypothetical protein